MAMGVTVLDPQIDRIASSGPPGRPARPLRGPTAQPQPRVDRDGRHLHVVHRYALKQAFRSREDRWNACFKA